jgi:hypothetical protein
MCLGYDESSPTECLWVGWSPQDKNGYFTVAYSEDSNIDAVHSWSSQSHAHPQRTINQHWTVSPPTIDGYKMTWQASRPFKAD